MFTLIGTSDRLIVRMIKAISEGRVHESKHTKIKKSETNV